MPCGAWGGVERRSERTWMQCRGLGAWGTLRFDGLKGKRFSGPFRSRSNRFEDRATSWRRDTALAEGRRICGLCDHTRPWSSDGCNSILTTVAVVSHHFTTMSPLSHPSGPVYAIPRLPGPVRARARGHQLPAPVQPDLTRCHALTTYLPV